jgi:endoglucanase
LNWYGAEQQDFVVGGLDFRSYQDILQTVAQQGYNCIRIPFSNQMVEQNPWITAHVSASPDLIGLHALDVLDRIVQYAGARGLSVILDDHRSDAGWSAQESGLWYTSAYPESAFDHDWSTLAARYAVSNVVIGADLRNEPHGPATWGDGNPLTDWQAAAERAGNAVLAANPHLLILVEGIQTYSTSASYWWGGNLMGVATAPVVLQFPDGSSARSQLVYSPHDYGPGNCAQGCPWFNATASYDSLAALWEQNWGYIVDDPTKPYAAPVFIGEFGTCNDQASCVRDTTPGSQGQWFSSLVRYIALKHVSWAYWSANGTRSTSSDASRAYGERDRYGLFSADWTTPSPWIQDALRPIQTDPALGAPGAGG